jgi:hypothetical protein
MKYLFLLVCCGLSFSSNLAKTALSSNIYSDSETFQDLKTDLSGKWKLNAVKEPIKEKELLRSFVLNKNQTATFTTSKGSFIGKWHAQKGDTLVNQKDLKIAISADIMLSFAINDQMQHAYFLTVEKKNDKLILSQDDNVWYERSK